MSSLFDKLKALFSAGVRGPQDYKRQDEEPAEAEPPEVAEAQPRRGRIPEVTEARPSRRPAWAKRRSEEPRPPARLEEPRQHEESDEELEAGRVVDLLNHTKDESES